MPFFPCHIKPAPSGLFSKPFLIIESTGHIPSIGNVSSDIAYKIGQLHGNIFKEPYVKGSDIQSFSAINDKDNLDSVVTLTESQKKDLIDEFGYERFTSIPNFSDLLASSINNLSASLSHSNQCMSSNPKSVNEISKSNFLIFTFSAFSEKPFLVGMFSDMY